METFTIDSENNIAAHAAVPANTDNLEAFATEKELAKLSADTRCTGRRSGGSRHTIRV